MDNYQIEQAVISWAKDIAEIISDCEWYQKHGGGGKEKEKAVAYDHIIDLIGLTKERYNYDD